MDKLVIQNTQVAAIGALDENAIGELSKAGIIPEGTPVAQVAIFARICKEKNLSPFSKQIYLINGGKGKYFTQIAIDGARSLANRTGQYAGQSEVTFDDGLSLDQCLAKAKAKPRTAKCTTYKIVSGIKVSFTASVSYREFSGGYNWNKRPFHMLAKVAEFHALKKGFPEELGGLYNENETFDNSYTETSISEQSDIYDEFYDKIQDEDSHENIQLILKDSKDRLSSENVIVLTKTAIFRLVELSDFEGNEKGKELIINQLNSKDISGSDVFNIYSNLYKSFDKTQGDD